MVSNDKTIPQIPLLNIYAQTLLFFCSAIVVGFGQPVFSYWLSVGAACTGYALFFRVVLEYEKPLQRFILGTFWFTLVQVIQLSWLVSHPYLYIWFVYLAFSAFLGTQFGILCLLIRKENLAKPIHLIGIAAIWMLLEWGRLFIMSGYTWNPTGLALTASLYSLQMASLWGIYGLTFWIMLVNIAALAAWLHFPKLRYSVLWLSLAVLPYAFGAAHLLYHDGQQKLSSDSRKPSISAVLVQTGFPVEEAMGFKDTKTLLNYVLGEWRQILSITAKHKGQSIDITAFPEFTVPFGTYTYVYPYYIVEKAFKEIWGKDSLAKLPALEYPIAKLVDTPNGSVWFVNNAYWVQSIANLLQSSVVMGLEDADDDENGKRHYYSSALHLKPLKKETEQLAYNGNALPAYKNFPYKSERYEKRVLVPMGEYIPFTFLQELAEEYGVYSSFTAGKEAKVFQCNGCGTPFGISICYEETFGDLMRQARQNGASMLLNLTSDVWYPNSRLPQLHFDHARLRTVESGIPLLRACNTGITGVTDSLGRVVAELGENRYEKEWLSDSIKLDVPMYSYQTLYTHTGDSLILSFCSLFATLFLVQQRRK